MCEFGLILSVLKGNKPQGFITSHASGLGRAAGTHIGTSNTQPSNRASQRSPHVHFTDVPSNLESCR
jgi:hypothetical protein